MITVLPLGPGDPACLTQAAHKLLFSTHHDNDHLLILRTARHPIADLLTQEHIPFSSLDDFYEASDDFDEMHRKMAEYLLCRSEHAEVCYAVPDPQSDASVQILRGKTKVHILPGVSLSDYYLAHLPEGFVPGETLLTCSASAFAACSPDHALMISEIHSRETAGQVKIALGDRYPDDFSVVLFSVCDLKVTAKVLPIYEIDRMPAYDHLTALYVPALPFMQRERYGVEDLVHIMSILRLDGGDPWDQEQTHLSLRPYLLEEAYEAAAAIDQEDMLHLSDELGDVLLQVVFHAAIAESCGDFNLTDISTAISSKMLHRHPAVFPWAATGQESDWENMKKEERGLKRDTDLLRDIPMALPSITRASKVLRRAAHLGFPVEMLLSSSDNSSRVLEDPSAQLFSLIAALSQKHLDAEDLLSKATDRFINRFDAFEKCINDQGKVLKALTAKEMDVYWHMVEAKGK
ncbi:MAG: hypothetical protein IJ865_06550 [Clostridia bacterium]|nr:hypothetical protein [Clostridia bacterium]